MRANCEEDLSQGLQGGRFTALLARELFTTRPAPPRGQLRVFGGLMSERVQVVRGNVTMFPAW